MAEAKRTPRKQPKQQRSRAMVEVILEAAARILVEAGDSLFNTNAVAARAGVSVGSLYQYFPSKEALISELSLRHADAMNHALRGITGDFSGAPLPILIRKLIDIMCAAHAVEPELHMALLRHAHRNIQDGPTAGEIDGQQLVLGLLQQRHGEVTVMDMEEAAFLVSTMVHETIHATVLHRPSMLQSDDFGDALAKMVLAYLTPSQPATQSPLVIGVKTHRMRQARTGR